MRYYLPFQNSYPHLYRGLLLYLFLHGHGLFHHHGLFLLLLPLQGQGILYLLYYED